ncbi:MAG: hypothetical protein JNL39_15305 [Opitutaceae bacterium]|nr:hypothetical protein [Opitutaceae bacterium]
MRSPARVFVSSVLLFAAALLMPAGRAAGDDGRFTTSLNAADRAAAGLGKLSSDNLAVIDALVRRDTARVAATATAPAGSSSAKGAEAGATFSQRLSADERRIAGLALLSPAEVAQLDALVSRQQTARLARTLLAPPVFLARPGRAVEPREKKTEREIHGSFSLSYGMGSGGYSERTGAINLSFEDPARGLTINVGYSESHIKGGRGYYGVPYALPPRPFAPDDSLRP